MVVSSTIFPCSTSHIASFVKLRRVHKSWKYIICHLILCMPRVGGTFLFYPMFLEDSLPFQDLDGAPFAPFPHSFWLDFISFCFIQFNFCLVSYATYPKYIICDNLFILILEVYGPSGIWHLVGGPSGLLTSSLRSGRVLVPLMVGHLTNISVH